MKRIASLLLFLPLMVAEEPTRKAGLSVHMLPDQVAKISDKHGGFSVLTVDSQELIFTNPQSLFIYFQQLPAGTQQNGIWIITTHPASYSETELANLKALITMCSEKKVAIFTIRASELPNGWKRAE